MSATLREGVAVRKEALLECHPPPAPWHAYLRSAGGGLEHFEGYLPVGDDLRPPRNASVGSCLGECLANRRCRAVTFEDADATPANATIVRCYAKAVAHRVVRRDADQVHGNALISGEWKLIQLGAVHPREEAGWLPPPGESPGSTSYQLGCDLEKQPKVVNQSECVAAPCLFHVVDDPCEYTDRAAEHPEVLGALRKRLAALQASAVPPLSPAACGCEPVVTNGVWRPCDAPDPELVDSTRQ